MKIKVQQEIEINIEAIMMLIAKKAEEGKMIDILDYQGKSLNDQIINVMKKLYGIELIEYAEDDDDDEEDDAELIEEIAEEISKKCFEVYADEVGALMFIKDNEMYYIYKGMY